MKKVDFKQLFEDAIVLGFETIKSLMRDNGITWLELDYNIPALNWHVPYILDERNGQTQKIRTIYLEPEENGTPEHLRVTTAEHKSIDLFDEKNENIDCAITGMQYLVIAAQTAVSKVLEDCIVIKKKDSVKELINKIRMSLGCNQGVMFQFGYPLPEMWPDTNLPTVICGFGHDGVVLKDNNHQWRTDYKNFSKGELQKIVHAINGYFIYIYNQCIK